MLVVVVLVITKLRDRASYISSQLSRYHSAAQRCDSVRIQHLKDKNILRNCGKQRSTHDGICIELWVGMLN